MIIARVTCRLLHCALNGDSGYLTNCLQSTLVVISFTIPHIIWSGLYYCLNPESSDPLYLKNVCTTDYVKEVQFVCSSAIAPLLHPLEDPLSIDIVDRLLPRSHVLSSSDPLLTPYSLLFFSSSIVSFKVSNCFIRDRSWSTSEAWKKEITYNRKIK